MRKVCFDFIYNDEFLFRNVEMLGDKWSGCYWSVKEVLIFFRRRECRGCLNIVFFGDYEV